MTNGILKKTTKKAAEEAKKVAKQAVGELVEIPKEAGRQATGVGTSPLVEAMQQGQIPSAVDIQQAKTQEVKDKARLDYLEKELEELTAKNRLLRQQSQAAQDASSQPSKPSLGPLVEPTTRPKRGMVTGLPGENRERKK